MVVALDTKTYGKITSLRIHPLIWKKAKVYAIENDVSMRELLEYLIVSELKERNLENDKRLIEDAREDIDVFLKFLKKGK